jgi:hypothetical protein
MDWPAVPATEAVNVEQSPDCASDSVLGIGGTNANQMLLDDSCTRRGNLAGRTDYPAFLVDYWVQNVE